MTEPEHNNRRQTPSTRFRRRVFRVIGFLAPFAFGFLVAFAVTRAINGFRSTIPPGSVWLGWTYYDIPSYYANAREVFENGNGFLYANPYSMDTHSPRVFASLQITAMAWLWKAGVQFATQEKIWRIVSWTLLAGLWWWVVAAYLPPGRWRIWTWFLVALGGGFAILPALGIVGADSLAPPPSVAGGSPASTPPFLQLLGFAQRDYEGVWGWWFLNQFRNILYSTECFYHVLFFGTVVAVLYRWWALAVVLAGATWWAHPFTGLELGAFLFLWSVVEAFLAWRHDEPVQPWIRFLAGLGFLDGFFLLYYGPFLGSFEEQRSLVDIWRGPEVTRLATAPLTHMLLSYGPLLLGLVWVVSRDGREHLKSSPIHRLLLVWFGVIFVLMHQDKLPGVRHPAQPLHFTRGYLYVVLCLWLGTLFARTNPAVPSRRRWLGVAAGVILAIAIADNALFFYRYFLGGEAQNFGLLSIPDSEYAMLTRLGKIPGNQLVFTIETQPTRNVGYLLNTYTPHRSFLGHGANTPFLRDRVAAYRDWVQKPQRGLLDIIGAQVVVAETAYVDRQQWGSGKKPLEFLDELLRGDFERAEAPDGYALWLRHAPQKPAGASGTAPPAAKPTPAAKQGSL